MRSTSSKLASAVLAGGLLLSIAGTASAADTQGVGDERRLSNELRGKFEVPGPGDPNGRGEFTAIISPDRLCYTLNAKKIKKATGAHIHVGQAGDSGPIAVTLNTPDRGGVSGCLDAVPDGQDDPTTLSRSEMRGLWANPSDFYVNVHNDDYPGGAVRGQVRN